MRTSCVLITMLTCLVGSSVDAADPLAWLPADVNAVARVNVAEAYKSPIAQKEGWIRQAAEAFIQQQAFVPPGTNQIVIGAEMSLSEGLVANRKFSVLVPDAGLTLEKLSPWLPFGIETAAGRSIAQFGNESYVADVGDGCWLAMSGSRQSISRWLRMKPTPGGDQLSRYLRTALNSPENKANVLLAIDLLDNFSQQDLVEELKETNWFKSEAVIAANAKILASIEGMTIGINADQERSGFAKIDFGSDAASLAPIVEKLVDAVLERAGVSSDDIEGWKWTVKGKRITGSGPVTPGGARRLLSILDPPSITHAISTGTSLTDEPNPEDRMRKLSQRYLKSVQVLLDDLRDTLNKSRDNHAVYFERYARKIDELPKLQVDSMLLDFSTKVSSSLRYQAQVQRMGNINAGTRKAQALNSSSSFVGPYGWYATMPNLGTGGVIDAEANQASKSVRFSEWKQIEEGLNAVRRALTEKYQVEF